jgi:hypothetical protein
LSQTRPDALETFRFFMDPLPGFRFTELEHSPHLLHGQTVVKETADLLERKAQVLERQNTMKDR